MSSKATPRPILIADCFVGTMAALTGVSALFRQEWLLAAWCGIALLYVAIAVMRGSTANTWRSTAERLSGR